MLDHTAVNVTDQDAARAFYTEALEPLGYTLVFEQGDFMGFGDASGLSFGVVRRDPVGGGHVAFRCDDHETVAAFYDAAIAAGGTDTPLACGRITTRTTTRPSSATRTRIELN